MVRMFISKNADFVNGHFAKKIVNKTRVGEMLIGSNAFCPDLFFDVRYFRCCLLQ